MLRIAKSFAAAVVFLCALPVLAQRDFSKVEIKVTKVAGPVHMLEGAGGNIGVSAGPDGLLIVDDQFAPLADKIRDALKALGAGKLRFLLNTHFHGDHTGSNAIFGKEATILAHTNVRKRLAAGGPAGDPPPAANEALPIITFDNGVSVHFNGEEIQAVHYDHAHTDGDVVIFFLRSNVVHMGDLFFRGHFPFVDLDSGGDVEGLSRAVDAILPKIPADAKVIPGHGPLSTKADLEEFARMLRETIGVVRTGLAQGKSLDQLKAAGLPEAWQGYSWEFINTSGWIETIHRSLTRESR